MRHIQRIALLVGLILCAGLLGCATPQLMGAKSDESMAQEGAPPMPPVALPAEPGASGSLSRTYGLTADTASDRGYRASLEEAEGERMIIRTAEVSILVKDTEATLDVLNGLVARYKGYVAESSRWYDDEQLYANMTLRVPAESLDAVLAEIGDLAIKIDSQNVSGDDVTEEYADLEARLRNLKAAEAELLELLTEVRQNRGKAEDILAVYREITQIRGQIESLEGRRIYLQRMTALSTVYLRIRPEATPLSVVEERWKPLVTASNAARALVSVVQGVLSFGIYVVVLSPIIIVPVGLLWLLAYLLRRRKRRRQASVK